MKKKAIALGLFIMTAFAGKALAQSNTLTSATAKEAYIDQANDYRKIESSYKLSQDTYNQVKTLASLEEAIINLKKVQVSRIKTLQSFYTALRLLVNETRGLEVQTKQLQVKNIDTVLVKLEELSVNLQKANDRITLNQQTAELEKFKPVFTGVAYSALTFIRISRVQSALDQLGLAAQLVYDDIQTRNLDANKGAEKQRAYDELVRLIENTKVKMLEIRTQAEEKKVNEYDLGGYSEVLGKLSTSHSSIRRGANFVQELYQ